MSKIIDLTLELYEGMPKFWGDYHAPFKSTITGTFVENQCLVRKLEMATHSGTHIDAPAHFFPDGKTLDQIPLDCFITEAVVLNLTHKSAGTQIGTGDLGNFICPQKGGVIINTGWYKMWDRNEFYKDFPILLPEAAKFCLQRGTQFLAVDIPLSAEVHRIVLGAGKILIENLTNLDKIKSERVKLIALPLKVRGAEAAPARVVAIEE